MISEYAHVSDSGITFESCNKNYKQKNFKNRNILFHKHSVSAACSKKLACLHALSLPVMAWLLVPCLGRVFNAMEVRTCRHCHMLHQYMPHECNRTSTCAAFDIHHAACFLSCVSVPLAFFCCASQVCASVLHTLHSTYWRCSRQFQSAMPEHRLVLQSAMPALWLSLPA